MFETNTPTHKIKIVAFQLLVGEIQIITAPDFLLGCLCEGHKFLTQLKTNMYVVVKGLVISHKNRKIVFKLIILKHLPCEEKTDDIKVKLDFWTKVSDVSTVSVNTGNWWSIGSANTCCFCVTCNIVTSYV